MNVWEALAEALTKQVGGLEAERRAALLTPVVLRLISDAEQLAYERGWRAALEGSGTA